jgi:dienelactone hydrolase
LFLSFACQTATADDIAGSSEALGKRPPNYEKTYERFDGKYDVASFTSTIARTGGLTGDPVAADFYYPDGCGGDKKRKKHEDHKWKKCHDKKEHKGLDRKTREDFADAFPIVPLLQGGNVPREQYSEFARELASFGFVVVVPDLKQSFGPPGSPQMYLTSQWVPNWVAADVAQRDADAASPLHQITDTGSMAVIGHSFGAAAALATVQGTCQPPFCFGPPFAYQRPAALKAAVVHGFQNCDPTQTQCFYPNTSAAPTMIVNGGLDDPGAPALTAYQYLTPARALVVVEGMNHFGLTNDDLASPTGPNPEPNELEQAESISRTARWTAAWLSAHLLGDQDATGLVFESGGVEGASVLSEM